jgi:hypothetical protein
MGSHRDDGAHVWYHLTLPTLPTHLAYCVVEQVQHGGDGLAVQHEKVDAPSLDVLVSLDVFACGCTLQWKSG